MNRLVIICVFLRLALPAAAAERDPRIGDVDPVMPAEKLERALNGTFNFPSSPEVAWTADERGFAKERLYHVPAAGVHPRILFAPEDLPEIRRRLASSEAGIATLGALRAMLVKGIGTKGTWEEQCYSALAAGDLDAFKTAFKENTQDNVPAGTGVQFNVPGRMAASNWGWSNPLLASMEAKALLALLDNDAASGKAVATALATYASFVGPKVDAANALPRHEFHWSSTRDYVPKEIAYGYDWAWPWMTSGQRDTVRSLIARSTAGKYTLGMDLPPHWRRWNYIGATASYTICLFAIEGEPGDEPRGRERAFEIYRDYLSYGIDALGMGTEGIGYQTGGLGAISPVLVAFANRGKNLLTHPHWRRLVDSWLVQAMQPFGGNWQTSGDLGNFPPQLDLVGLQKYFYPDSAGVDFVFRNHPTVAKKEWGNLVSNTVSAPEVLWLFPALPAADDTREAAQKEAAARVGGGLSFHDPQRGSLYTRSGWGVDDLNLHVDCRLDTPYPSHDHADRGQFTLASHGRAWACDGSRDTESKFHNLVTIDGRGQAFFPTPGAWIEFQDTAQSTTAIIDAKYCWDWMWTHSCFLESKASLERRNQASCVESAGRTLARFPLEKWEVDPLPMVTAYYQGFADRAHGDPRMWNDESSWQLRAPWYPVRKAFRSVTLARGKHPYVLVVDDIRKDDAEHLYEWRMNAPPDVSAVSISGKDILLGDLTTARKPLNVSGAFQGTTNMEPARGDRLLLVRTLDIGLPELPTFQPIPMVAAVEFKKTDESHQFANRSMGMGTQVVIGSRSVEPKFVIMLFPHRHGDEMPATSWNEDRTRLTIAWMDQTDIYAVSVTANGRRIFNRLEHPTP